MLFRLLSRLLLTAVFMAAAIPDHAQSVYAARQSKVDLAFGGGGSNFDPDFAQGPAPRYLEQTGMGQGRRWGYTVWADAGMPFGPRWLRGFRAEVQYRSVYAGVMVEQMGLKEQTVGGGATYTLRHWQSLRPYGKYIFSLGSISFTPIPLPLGSSYSQDSRAVQALGGGIELRCSEHISARADYEYQLWGRLLGAPDFTPQGVTVGAMYSLRKSAIR
ncbi:MAG: outer membrane beta-barrel protein [Terracidiphilus sp.]|jgi:opacity protein-like surface antigen